LDTHPQADDPRFLTPASPQISSPPQSVASSSTAAEVGAAETVGGWFRQNWSKLAIAIAVFALICRYLHPLDVLLAGLGLSLIIFLHELGHFLAAKWCDVHVKTFSIGFGPSLPFCQFQYGETTYKLAMIPLGGYVAMVGESDEESDTDSEGEGAAADDPRSFKNKSVGQRMLIISAGVIMNLILGCLCFMVTYLHGVREMPAVAASVEPGSAAWVAGIHSGSEITRINRRMNPWFDDLRPIVSSTHVGETVSLDIVYRGQTRSLEVEPTRPAGALFPVLGIRPPERLVLRRIRREAVPPYLVGSVAARAKASDGGEGFLPGDRLIAMTDPEHPDQVKPFEANFDGLPGEYFDYLNRLTRLAGQPLTFQVQRHAEAGNKAPVEATIIVPPAYRQSLGLRMRIGPVTAIRVGSAAEGQIYPGDRLVEVALEYPGKEKRRYVAGQPRPGESPDRELLLPLDPLRLPLELNTWSDRWLSEYSEGSWPESQRLITVTVLRHRDGDHTETPVRVELRWDPSYRNEPTDPSVPGAPIPINGLGFGYMVDHIVDAVEPDSPAARAGLKANDQLSAIRFFAENYDGSLIEGSWEEIQPQQWGYVDYKLQLQYPHQVVARIKRDGQFLEVPLEAVADPTWPVVDRGLILSRETRIQQADSVLEALEMGAYRTARSIRMIYQGLYAMVFGRISVKMMSGPITLARASYFIAGEDIWTLMLWVGLISVNLAVVNFLPIPVLDGGHMVFLIYEWIRGKPAPVSIQVIFTYIGLAFIVGLMLFVIGLDLWRLFFAD